MSGGSFDYLYRAEAGDIVWRLPDVDRMCRYLKQLQDEGSPCAGAIAETSEVVEALDRLHSLIYNGRLEKVWHAAEWHRSSDWGIQQFRDVVAEHYPDDIARDARLRAVILELSEHGDLTPSGKRVLNNILDGEQ